ncbi:MAG: hypothetical protein HEP71_03785 [Roseivirga sp.]|nr:hypothetical protein [Roseivirga sp.]
MQRLYRLTPFSLIFIVLLGLAGLMVYSRSFWMPTEGCGLYSIMPFGVTLMGFAVILLDRWLKQAMSLRTVWLVEAVCLLACFLMR